VTAIEPPVLYTGSGRWQAETVIVCSGDDFETLYPQHYAASGLTRCKLQMMRTAPQPDGWQLGPSLAAGLTLAAIVYYVVIYTMLLKRHTSQSTLWGGACGAAPVVIAWAAATGSLAWPAWLLFGVVFFWQPPHFWALAIKYRDDYRSAGIPMLPVVASVRRVLAESVVYSWLMVAASLAVWPWAGPLYGGVAIVAGAAFLYEVHRLFHLSRQTAAADAAGASSGDGLVTMRLFHLSLVYLTVVFAAVAAGAFIR